MLKNEKHNSDDKLSSSQLNYYFSIYFFFFSKKHTHRSDCCHFSLHCTFNSNQTTPRLSFLISSNPMYCPQPPFCFTLHIHVTLTQFLPPTAFIFLNSIKFLSSSIFLTDSNVSSALFKYHSKYFSLPQIKYCFCLEWTSCYLSAQILCIIQGPK